MTKEDILNDAGLRRELFLTNPPTPTGAALFDEQVILKAMDEYAKQQAIAFSKWCSLNEFIDCEIPMGWKSDNIKYPDVYTDEQLFQLFEKEHINSL